MLCVAAPNTLTITRACGKRIVWTLRRRLLRPEQFQAALDKLPSPGLRRKAREVCCKAGDLPAHCQLLFSSHATPSWHQS